MRFPLSAQTIYQDLLEMHRLRSISAIGGTPRPHELEDACQTALESGPKWREAIQRSLKQRPEVHRLIASLS